MTTKTRLSAAIAEINSLEDSAKLKVQGGKFYVQVKDRLNIFRKHFGESASIITEPVRLDDQGVVFKSTIIMDGQVIATGHSEEIRGTTAINRKAAVEKAETSSMGRALAALGLSGGEIASADEMVNAGVVDAPATEPAEFNPRDALTVIYKSINVKTLSDEDRADLNKAFALVSKRAEEAAQ